MREHDSGCSVGSSSTRECSKIIPHRVQGHLTSHHRVQLARELALMACCMMLDPLMHDRS